MHAKNFTFTSDDFDVIIVHLNGIGYRFPFCLSKISKNTTFYKISASVSVQSVFYFCAQLALTNKYRLFLPAYTVFFLEFLEIHRLRSLQHQYAILNE